MKTRSMHVRTKVTALLLSLVALWAFAAFVTIREGLNLLSVSTLDSGVGRPADAMIAELQEERRLSVVELGAAPPAIVQELVAQRARTDAAVAVFKQRSGAASVHFAGSDVLLRRLSDAVTQVDTLAASRQAVDSRTFSRAAAAAGFTKMIDTTFLIFDSLATLDDKDLAKDIRTLIILSRAREVLAQEDTLLAGALAAGDLSEVDRVTFTQLVGTQRYLYDQGQAELPPTQLAEFQQFTGGADLQHLRDLENMVITGPPIDGLPVSTGAWDATNQAVFAHLRDIEQAAADDIVRRATPAGAWVVLRLALAAGLGLIAVIASVIVSITTARSLVRQLERLRNAALDLASDRLPRVVDRLQRGERVDIAHEAPPLNFGRDEIGQVGQAFNTVQETAVRVAVEQAELRRSVRDVFLSLARRSQALLHRQLALLDSMERRSTEPEELSELFRIDHLATRMRRNAENLIVLSGATAGRAWRKPVAMLDVLRGALAEVEDYTRVEVLPVGAASLQGRAVGDVIHLLAELIENAVSFSPPETTVRVGGSLVGNGFAVEIEDRGLGLSPDELTMANSQIAEPPEFKLTSTARLGLYVIGHLADRHDIKVRLTESPYGGITAVVLLPSSIMADDESSNDPLLDARAPTLVVTGRHREKSVAERLQVTGSVYSGSVVAEPEWYGGNSKPRRFELPDPEPSAPPPPSAPSTAEIVPPRGEATVFTPSGLPWRDRDAGARSRHTVIPAPAAEAPAGRTGPDGGRPIEEIRSMLTSYRAGTLQGRQDSARLVNGDSVIATTVPNGHVNGTAPVSGEGSDVPEADHSP